MIAWENIKEGIKISAKDSLGLCELKQHKPCFDEECSRFLEKKEAGENLVVTGSISKQYRLTV